MRRKFGGLPPNTCETAHRRATPSCKSWPTTDCKNFVLVSSSGPSVRRSSSGPTTTWRVVRRSISCAATKTAIFRRGGRSTSSLRSPTGSAGFGAARTAMPPRLTSVTSSTGSCVYTGRCRYQRRKSPGLNSYSKPTMPRPGDWRREVAYPLPGYANSSCPNMWRESAKSATARSARIRDTGRRSRTQSSRWSARYRRSPVGPFWAASKLLRPGT